MKKLALLIAILMISSTGFRVEGHDLTSTTSLVAMQADAPVQPSEGDSAAEDANALPPSTTSDDGLPNNAAQAPSQAAVNVEVPSQLLDIFNLAIAVQILLLTVMTLGGGVLTFLGIREWRSIKASAGRAQNSVASIERSQELVARLANSAPEIQNRMIAILDPLLENLESTLGVTTILGDTAAPNPDLLVLSQLDQLDHVFYALHHLSLLPNSDSATRALIKLTRHWRQQKDFPRALTRLELASELAPTKLTPVVDAQRAVTLTNWAGWAMQDDSVQIWKKPDDLLDEAMEILNRVAEKKLIEGMDLLYLKGIIFHIQGHFPEASEAFRKALQPDAAMKAGEESLVDTTKVAVRYNLAASLSREGRLEEAAQELSALPPEEWRHAARDPDFVALKGHAALEGHPALSQEFGAASEG